MACKVKKNIDGDVVGMEAPNGKPSILYNKLKDIVGTDAAYTIYAHTQTKAFTDWFGMNWTTDPEAVKSLTTDANGEPKLLSGDGKFEFMNVLGNSQTVNHVSGVVKESVAISKRTSLVDPQFETEVLDTAITMITDIRDVDPALFADGKRMAQFFNIQKDPDTGKIMDKGDLAMLMLVESFPGLTRSAADLRTSVRLFNTFKDAGGGTAGLTAMLSEIEKLKGVSLDKNSALVFFDMYDKWADIVDPETGNVERVGWRTKIQDRLAAHGMKLRDDLGTIEEFDDDILRIHNISRLQENPKDKLSAVTKSALSNIKSITANRLGYYTNIPIDAIYSEIAEATVDQVSLPGMLAQLKNLSKYKPGLAPVIERIENMSAAEQAAFFSNFNNAYKNFLQFSLEKIQTAEGERIISKMFNPNESDTARKYRTLYKRNAIEGLTPNPRALYQLEEKDGNEVFVVSAAKKIAIDAAWNNMTSAVKGLGITSAVPSEAIEGLANYLWEMGMQYGPTLESTQSSLQQYFTIGALVGNTQLKGMALFNNFVKNPKSPLEALNVVLNKETRNNIYTEKGKTINRIAAIAPLFDGKAFGSFVSGTGKSYFPINLPTSLDEFITSLGTEEGIQHLESLMGDPFVNPGVNYRHQSPLVTLLLNNTAVRNAFGASKLDSFSSASNVISDYENQSSKTSIIVRLNAYANNDNSKFMRIGIQTQADRTTLDFVQLPRFSNLSALGHDVSKRDTLKALVIQDLARMSQANAQIKKAATSGDTTQLIEGYHYKEGSNPLAGDGAAFTMSQITGLENVVLQDNGVSPVKMSDVIDNYLRGDEFFMISDNGMAFQAALEAEVNKIEAKLLNYEERVKADIDKYGIDLKTEVQSALSNRVDFISEFVFNDFVAKIELAKVLRSGFNFSKNAEDFYKRMGLLNTPGQKLLIRGDSKSDLNYGMLDTYSELVIADYGFTDPATANVTADNMFANLVLANVPEGTAKYISDKYRPESADNPGGVNKTDAQGLISIDMYRGIQMGIGAWDMVLDEQAYKNEKAGNGFVDNAGNHRAIYPIKPYHEELVNKNGTNVLYMNKNSYLTVTKEFAAGMPEFQKVHDAMEKGIHVVNVRTATKGARSNVQDLQTLEALDVSNPTMMNSRKLRLPQLLPKRKQEVITFSRQVRKNLVTNLKLDGIYDLAGAGLVTGQNIFALWNDLIVKNLSEDTAILEDRMGMTALKGALETDGRTSELYKATKLAYLQNVRDILQEQVKDKDLPENYSRALDIVADGPFDYKFRIPMSFPNFQAKFEQIFFSTYSNDIFKQKIKGKELVQIAELGGHAIDGELQMYDGRNPADVRMKRSALGLPDDIAIEDVDAGMLDLIGYRVPNQGKNSALPMRVIGFLPESHEKAIQVPGGVTKQMGADFDVDKMFVIQPETELVETEDGGTLIRKINPDFNQLDILTRRERDTALFNIMNSVLMSEHHLEEVLTPLDSPRLENLAAKLRGTESVVDLNYPLSEIDMEAKNKAGVALRGLWANALAGRNVAQAGNLTVSAKYAPIIKYEGKEVEFTRIGVTREYNPVTGAFDGAYTDSSISMYLSAAVDAAKKPIQIDVNDNTFTVPVAGLLLSLGVPVEDVVYFLAQPSIKATIEHAQVNDYTLGQLTKSISVQAGILKGKIESESNPVMDSAELQDVSGADAAKQIGYLNNLHKFFLAGRNLQTVYKIITPDNVSNANEMSAITSWIDTEVRFTKNGDDTIIKGAENFIGSESTSYPVMSAYRAYFDTVLGAAEMVGFVNNRPSFFAFKESLKDKIGKYSLSAAQHKFVDRALMLKVMAHPNSPLKNYLSPEAFNRMYTDPINNIATELAKMKAKYTNINTNPFVSSLQPDSANATSNTIYKIKFDNSFDMSAHDKNKYTSGMFNLLAKPEMFANDPSDPAQLKEIRNFGRMLVSNQLLSDGYFPGSGSYIDLVPVEAWTTTILFDDKSSMTPVEFFNGQANTGLYNQDFFEGFQHEFVRNFGLAKPGGTPFLKTVKWTGMPGSKVNPKTGLSKAPASVTFPSEDSRVYDSTLGYVGYFVTYHPVDGPLVYSRKDTDTYSLMNSLGENKRVHEIFSNQTNSDSLIPGRVGAIDAPGRNYVTERSTADVVMHESVEKPLKVCKL